MKPVVDSFITFQRVAFYRRPYRIRLKRPCVQHQYGDAAEASQLIQWGRSVEWFTLSIINGSLPALSVQATVHVFLCELFWFCGGSGAAEVEAKHYSKSSWPYSHQSPELSKHMQLSRRLFCCPMWMNLIFRMIVASPPSQLRTTH